MVKISATTMRVVLSLLVWTPLVSGFLPNLSRSEAGVMMSATPLSKAVCEPSQREETYGSNLAQYLVDLHDAQSTFDFCGGMMFQLVLSSKLREHLRNVAQNNGAEHQPILFDASKPRMHQIPGYEESAAVDNVRIFHGREIRQVADAAGGMGMVLQLSLAGADDPEGWTSAEIEGYDGWKHDVGRVWRNGDRLEEEGFVGFKNQFGEKAYTLNHRFYLHLDRAGSLWLAAEDGCEGTPALSPRSKNLFSSLFGL